MANELNQLNPRTLRDKLGPFVGKKVVIGTTDWHYISCRVTLLEGDTVHVTVAGKGVTIPAKNVATIHEVAEHQAEYIK